mmetsp:Transcript_43128/g.113570  ORF Transcript_43128/g.113570 Transcript_43128/m.113570 type:complete len:98 (+) Transcript_43128:457-750(+)
MPSPTTKAERADPILTWSSVQVLSAEKVLQLWSFCRTLANLGCAFPSSKKSRKVRCQCPTVCVMVQVRVPLATVAGMWDMGLVMQNRSGTCDVGLDV